MDTLSRIQGLVALGDVRISEHGYDEMAEDGIPVRDTLAGVASAVVVEDYPEFGKGPSVLVMQSDRAGEPVHVAWGIPRGHSSPAVLVTADRSDPQGWSDDFLRRRR
jgi:hypothetical protein